MYQQINQQHIIKVEALKVKIGTVIGLKVVVTNQFVLDIIYLIYF